MSLLRGGAFGSPNHRHWELSSGLVRAVLSSIRVFPAGQAESPNQAEITGSLKIGGNKYTQVRRALSS